MIWSMHRSAPKRVTVKGLQRRLSNEFWYTAKVQPRVGAMPATVGGNAKRTAYQLWLMEAHDLLDSKPEAAEQIVKEWASRRDSLYPKPGTSDPTRVVIRQ